MRHRPVKNSEQIIEEGRKWLAEEPESLAGRWASLFDAEKQGEDAEYSRKLYLEIGSGKGRFITEEARKHPENNYLACEGGGKIYPRILQKIAELEIVNLRVIPYYHLKERPYFSAGELDGIYLNFSDPWPKARNEKRRLTHRGFLEQYKSFVKPGGFLSFKTDNDGLFAWSLLEFSACGLEIRRITRDLHASKWQDDLLMTELPVADLSVTEYEEKFIACGKSINYALVIF